LNAFKEAGPVDWKTTMYLIYLALSIGLTLWVGRTLFTNGSVFLTDVFDCRADLARSVNSLLVVGFYLVNLGLVSLALRTEASVATGTEAIEALSRKMGLILVTVGLLHLLNVAVLSKVRRLKQDQVPPAAPPGHPHPATRR
jgi:hypothetical protein